MIFYLILGLVIGCNNIQAANTVPISSTAKPQPPKLSADLHTIITKLNNQVKDYMSSSNIQTLNTLGDYLRNEVLKTFNNLSNTFASNIQNAQKTDVAASVGSHPYEAFMTLNLFFTQIKNAVNPLSQKYTTLKANFAAKKQQNAQAKTPSDPTLSHEEFCALESNILLPFNTLKDCMSDSRDAALSKLLEYVNW